MESINSKPDLIHVFKLENSKIFETFQNRDHDQSCEIGDIWKKN